MKFFWISTRTLASFVLTWMLVSSTPLGPDVFQKDIAQGLILNNATDRDSKLILNPFSILGNPPCNYGGQQGVCYGEVECLALAGQFGDFCPGLTGLCCLFYRNCGQRTAQEVSYFRNSHWPLVSAPESDCDFRVIKKDATYCGVRIDSNQEVSKTTSCTNVYLQVSGVPFKGKIHLCGQRSTGTYQLDMKHVDELTFSMNYKRQINSAWNVKVTQIKCDEFDGESLPDSTGTEQVVEQTTKRPKPTVRPPTSTQNPFLTTTAGGVVGPPSPPAVTSAPDVSGTFGRCGISSPQFKFSETTTEERRLKRPTTSSTVKRGNDRNRPPIATRDEPAIVDLEVTGPHTADSLFELYSRAKPSNVTQEFTRITFGTETRRNEFPWQVAMSVNGRFHCGGSIIGDYYVLTAAHCVKSYIYRPSSLTLILGDWDLKSTSDGGSVKVVPESIRVHSGYSRTKLQNDIAVVKLKERIRYNRNVQPICLPDRDYNLVNDLATVTGWGRNEHGQLETKLQKLQATIIPNSECDNMWNKKGSPNGFIASTMMCMEAIDGDSCNGDSGGPSVYRDGGSMVQVGVVSFGSGSCQDPNLPGVYTRVSKYRDWIRQQMY